MTASTANSVSDPPPVHGYLLAGGRSTRMGTDKALIHLNGSTLLERAIHTLSTATATITLVGRAHPSLAHIADAAEAIGPVGGVTAALRHLAAQRRTLALFLPVDLPLLPPGLLRALASLWAARPTTRVAFPIAEGIPQPVVSLLHVAALPTFEAALRDGQHRLRPLLEAAAGTPGALTRTVLRLDGNTVFADDEPLPWRPSPAECRLAPLWFSNCNTPAELALIKQAVQPSPVAVSSPENLY